MKSFEKMVIDVSKIIDTLPKQLVESQRETARQIWEDVIQYAPAKSGEYISSIKISDTEVNSDSIKTSVYTDLTSDGYAVGRMIENGTGIYALEPHIGHTKTFIESGYQYWFVPVKSVNRAIGRKIVINGNEFYVAYAQPAKPHFRPALNKNINNYKKNTGKALKEVIK